MRARGLEDSKWVHPNSYAGFSPDGDYLIVTQHRESDALDRSNWTTVKAHLTKLSDAAGDPPEERL